MEIDGDIEDLVLANLTREETQTLERTSSALQKHAFGTLALSNFFETEFNTCRNAGNTSVTKENFMFVLIPIAQLR